jgi:hypothetical protein
VLDQPPLNPLQRKEERPPHGTQHAVCRTRTFEVAAADRCSTCKESYCAGWRELPVVHGPVIQTIKREVRRLVRILTGLVNVELHTEAGLLSWMQVPVRETK